MKKNKVLKAIVNIMVDAALVLVGGAVALIGGSSAVTDISSMMPVKTTPAVEAQAVVKEEARVSNEGNGNDAQA